MTGSASKNARLLLAGLLFAAMAAGMMWFGFSYAPYQENEHRVLVAALSTIASVLVIAIHYSYAPHPKFTVIPTRRRILRLHLVIGTVEIIAAIVAYFSSGPEVAATIVGIAALIHVATSIYQTPTVFGAHALMIPGYGLFIAIHTVSAVNLLLEPRSEFWLLNTFITLNTYAWVRIILGVLMAAGLFEQSRYSVSIVFAGMLTIPAVLGPAGGAFVLIYEFIGVAIVRYVVRLEGGLKRGVLEHLRWEMMDNEVQQVWEQSKLNLDKRATMSARNTAVLAFEALDEDEQGYLTSDDIRSILLEWNTPPDFVEKLVEHIGHDDKLTFDDFYKYLWTISSFRQRLRTNVKLHEMPEDASDEQKARFVFDEIDLDSNGYIDVFELRMVVDAWGMPNSEAENYIKRFGDAQGRISFEVFHSELAPIWKFGYSVQHFRHGMRHPHHQH